MKTHTLLAALTLALTASSVAAQHAHKPMHGGLVIEVKDIDYELVARPASIQLYLRDHSKPVDISKASARLTLLSGSEKQELELKPAGDKLEATGTFKVGPGTKAVAVVTIAGKAAGTLRFALK